ncbi:MAG: hypothetical protein ACYCTZ_02885 [Candidatus Dormibacteria bacterium]
MNKDTSRRAPVHVRADDRTLTGGAGLLLSGELVHRLELVGRLEGESETVGRPSTGPDQLQVGGAEGVVGADLLVARACGEGSMPSSSSGRSSREGIANPNTVYLDDRYGFS